MDFSENLKKIRKKSGLSQQALADMLHVSQSTVGMWESRRRTPKLDEINRIAKALRVTVQRLLGEKQRKIEIIKNAVYVDGEKIKELESGDIYKILEHIDLLKAAKKAAPLKTPPRMTSGARKILIIDDEPDICETLYSFLAPHNYKVFMAFNGQMGLEYFDEVKPDIVLLDLSMPDIEGLDVLRIIRKISDVPVLVITAHPEDVVDIHAGDLHIEGYIEKPFSLEKILNSIKHILGK